MTKHTRPVYSTDSGRICPDCGLPIAACRCKSPSAAVPKGDGVVRVAVDAVAEFGDRHPLAAPQVQHQQDLGVPAGEPVRGAV